LFMSRYQKWTHCTYFDVIILDALVTGRIISLPVPAVIS
jgi:hypothetical protein